MEKSLLIKFLGQNPVFSIIDFLIENKGMDVTKKLLELESILIGKALDRAKLIKIAA